MASQSKTSFPSSYLLSIQCDVRYLSCSLYSASNFTLQGCMCGKCSNLQQIHQSHTFRIKYLHAQKKDLTSNLYPWKSENLRLIKYYY